MPILHMVCSKAAPVTNQHLHSNLKATGVLCKLGFVLQVFGFRLGDGNERLEVLNAGNLDPRSMQKNDLPGHCLVLGAILLHTVGVQARTTLKGTPSTHSNMGVWTSQAHLKLKSPVGFRVSAVPSSGLLSFVRDTPDQMKATRRRCQLRVCLAARSCVKPNTGSFKPKA